jgi:hypothetical protein
MPWSMSTVTTWLVTYTGLSPSDSRERGGASVQSETPTRKSGGGVKLVCTTDSTENIKTEDGGSTFP